MKPSLRDAGLFLLGVGVLIFSLIALHFYLTEVLPRSSEVSISVYCDGQGNRFFVYVNNYGGVEAKNLSVTYSDAALCTYETLTPGSSVVCPFSSDENFPVVEVKASVGGREVVRSAVCRRVAIFGVNHGSD